MDLFTFDNVFTILEQYANDIRNSYQDSLIKNDRIASGYLLNNIDFKVINEGNVFNVTFMMPKYWEYVEYNTKPHLPPVNKILEWIQVKPILPQPNDKGKLPTPESLAWAIAKKIEKSGTKGTHDLENTVNDVLTNFTRDLQKAFQQDLNETLLTIFANK